MQRIPSAASREESDWRDDRGLILQGPACHSKAIRKCSYFTPLFSLQILFPLPQLGLRLKGPLTKKVDFTIQGHCGQGNERALSN